MSAKFDVLVKKRRIAAIVASSLCAVASAAIVYGALMLISKLASIEILLAVEIISAAAVGVIVGGLSFLFTFSTSRALARKIDVRHGLSERLETMLAFQDDEGEVAKLQRADADEHLSRIDTKMPFMKHFGAALISVILAIAIMIPAILVPLAQNNGGGGDNNTDTSEPFELKSWQCDRLKRLIENVEEAEIDAEFKSAAVTELKRLTDVLKKTDTVDKMQAEVIAAIVLTDAAAEKTAGYKMIAVALFSARPYEDEAVNAPQDLETYKVIKDIARSVAKLNGIAFGQDLNEIRKYFASDTVINTDDTLADSTPDTAEANGKQSDKGADKIITVTDKLTSLASEIRRTLGTDIPENDALKVSFLAFADKIEACIGETVEITRQGLIDKAFDELSASVSLVLSAQYENKAIRDTVINTLMLLFNIEKSMLPPLLGDQLPLLTDNGDSSGGDDQSGSVSGGYGDGNELYGSNDTIYHPFGEMGAGHKLYGDVYDEYYRIISDLLSDESISEETRRAMAEYFRKLSDGSDGK